MDKIGVDKVSNSLKILLSILTSSQNKSEIKLNDSNRKNKNRRNIFNFDFNSNFYNTDAYLNILKSLIHYGDNIGARCVNCVINENSYETSSLLTQDYDIYQVTLSTKNYFSNHQVLIVLKKSPGTSTLCNVRHNIER
jgi:hypothetical protein